VMSSYRRGTLPHSLNIDYDMFPLLYELITEPST